MTRGQPRSSVGMHQETQQPYGHKDQYRLSPQKSQCVYTVTSTVFESKDEPTQMTKQSFTMIYFITYKKTIHFKLICKNVHSRRQYFSKHMDTVQ